MSYRLDKALVPNQRLSFLFIGHGSYTGASTCFVTVAPTVIPSTGFPSSEPTSVPTGEPTARFHPTITTTPSSTGLTGKYTTA